MKTSISADELLRAIARTGYFQQESFDPTDLCKLLDQLRIKHHRALDLLTEAGLATFQYTTDPLVHPKDSLDFWKLSLTEVGAKVLGMGSD
jgi:hypothetical protein